MAEPVNAYGNIYDVCRLGDELEVRRLVRMGVSPHKQDASVGVYPLHRASEIGCLPIVRFLVEECRVDANVKDHSGTTPLHYAVYNGHTEVVKYLIERAHADYHVENNDKLTLVHNACYTGRLDLLRYFVLELGLDPEYRNKDGITPLHNTTFNGHPRCAEFLLTEIGVAVNVCNRSKLTPIRNTCSNNHIVACRLVASFGADYTIIDHTGNNSLQLATDKPKAKAAIALGAVDWTWRRRSYALMMWVSWNDTAWKVDNLSAAAATL